MTHTFELPEGWRRLDAQGSAGLTRELQRELAPGHPLEGLALGAIAARIGPDDVLYRHLGVPDRFTVVHLTWASRRERTPDFPSIEFGGASAEFLAFDAGLREEERLAGDS